MMRTRYRAAALILAFLGVPAMPVAGVVLPARAETADATAGQGAVTPDAGVARLIAVMRINEVIDVLHQEGIAYGATIEEGMFPGGGGAAWTRTVADIYDPARMKASFAEKLADALKADPAALDAMTGFFASDLGQQVLGLELQARRALLDDETKAAAELAWSDLAAGGGARVDLLRKFAATNDLIEANVMGALNANLAFYKGMAESGAFEGGLPEDEMLAEVWSQEPEIRQQTEDWVFPYLAMSYSSLTEDELDDYVRFSASPEGQRLNNALFAAFDAVFVPISQALGAAAAAQIEGQDI